MATKKSPESTTAETITRLSVVEPQDVVDALRLRDAVRAVILAGCGEPDLGELIKPAPSPAGSTR